MAFALTGTARLDTGEAASLVVVRAWDTHAHVATVVPDAGGAWELAVPAAGPYDVTVRGPVGYRPACDGPIVAEAAP